MTSRGRGFPLYSLYIRSLQTALTRTEQGAYQHYMPVTFSPAKKDIEPFDTDFFEAREALTSQADRILKRACYQQYKQADEILQSSFDTFSRQSKEQVLEITPQSNGFVSTVLEAYNRHRALVI